MKGEVEWGLFRHTRGDHSRWVLSWVQSLVNTCRQGQLDSLADLDVGGCNDFSRLIAREILHELRLVYFAPAGTRDAGFLETEHFGVRFPHRAGHFSLTAVSQRWLRDLLWDFLAGWLRSPNSPATAASFARMRLAGVQLSAFLEDDTPQAVHTPSSRPAAVWAGPPASAGPPPAATTACRCCGTTRPRSATTTRPSASPKPSASFSPSASARQSSDSCNATAASPPPRSGPLSRCSPPGCATPAAPGQSAPARSTSSSATGPASSNSAATTSPTRPGIPWQQISCGTAPACTTSAATSATSPNA